ncbi:gas vesicle protein GvpG [Streptacidiphilus sp. ASG 303]|uniref:gas vesicle protein GvpG n=1 Tax=Streptomycetaceae TaxID=2062 RepID=UPI001E64E936|nr:gas vesicle protein GvpG [Streptacidiphilus sp. ASG 303]MCD0485931.1 gas vesicle protein GvpG [Streptacidiphilus sp. ASG 303]
MGLLTGILCLPLAPVRGVVWVADRAVEAAACEVRDPTVLRARLAALNQALEDGEIGMEEFEKEEDRLLDLLEGRQPGMVRPPGAVGR